MSCSSDDKQEALQVPLLHRSQEDDDFHSSGSYSWASEVLQSHKKKSNLRMICWCLVFSNALSLMFLVFVSLRLFTRDAFQVNLLPSPAQRAISYEVQTWPTSFRQSKFAGPPRPELEKSWHDLLNYSMSRFERQEIDELGLTSLPLKDGGYAVQLGVFHELHCLKKIRHWSYRDHYLANTSDEEMREWASHIDHCIETLRLSTLCKADTAVSTFSWLGEGDAKQPTIEGTGPHQCVNWDKFMVWVKQRSFDISNQGVFA